jgi:aerobic-type carbon monoxide dehydrogenase small subunit (CoxS/CutS family)
LLNPRTCDSLNRAILFLHTTFSSASRIVQQTIAFKVNGKEVSIATEGDRSLLEVLREDLELTGTKYGCGEGECGACTVLLGDEAVRSCVTRVAEVAGMSLTTIEGLAEGNELHPVQQAFLDKDAAQCGYCIPGQILSAVALLRAKPQAAREEIIEAMTGNLCRCCNYVNILAAVEQAAEQE